MPSDAKDVRIGEEKADAIAINGWASRQFVFTFSLFSIPYRRSITFLNYGGKEQIILDIGAAAPRVLKSLSESNSDGASGPTWGAVGRASRG